MPLIYTADKTELGLSADGLDCLSHIVRKSAARPHLLTVNRGLAGRSVITAHTSKAVSNYRDRRALVAELKASGVPAQFRVRTMEAKTLAKQPSIEALINKYGNGEIVHDQLGVFSRSACLVQFAKLMRVYLDAKVHGIYWQSQSRTVYIVLNPSDFFTNYKVERTDLAMVERMALKTLRDACGAEAVDYVQALRVSFQFPAMELVPVDQSSRIARPAWMKALRGRAIGPAVSAVIGVGVVGGATAADVETMQSGYAAPAVSGPNGKLSVLGGHVSSDVTDDGGIGLVGGAFSMPLTYSTGFQIDGAAGSFSGDFVGGVAGHLFWRDPSSGLVGLTAGYTQIDDFANTGNDEGIGRVGAEAELYLGQFTAAAAAGHQFGDNSDDGFYGTLDLTWYATDNLALSVGALSSPNLDYGLTLGAEYQPGLSSFPGLALFADATFGDEDHIGVYGGLRFYFGDDKPLIDRHRFDDPDNDALSTILANLGGSSRIY